MLRIGAVVLNVSDRERSRQFWQECLDYTSGDNSDFLLPRHDGAPRLHLDNDDATHLDLWVDSAAEQEAEVARLMELGATRVDWDYPDDADFVVLADPSGTLFCVIDTSR